MIAVGEDFVQKLDGKGRVVSKHLGHRLVVTTIFHGSTLFVPVAPVARRGIDVLALSSLIAVSTEPAIAEVAPARVFFIVEAPKLALVNQA